MLHFTCPLRLKIWAWITNLEWWVLTPYSTSLSRWAQPSWVIDRCGLIAIQATALILDNFYKAFGQEIPSSSQSIDPFRQCH